MQAFLGEGKRTFHHLEANSANIPIAYLPDIKALVIQTTALIDHLCDSMATTEMFNSVSEELFKPMEDKYFQNLFISIPLCQALRQPDRGRYENF